MTVQINETSLVLRKTESHCEQLKNAKPKRAGQKLKQFGERLLLTNLTTLFALETISTNVLMIVLKQHKQELLEIYGPIYEWSKDCGKFMQIARRLISALNDFKNFHDHQRMRKLHVLQYLLCISIITASLLNFEGGSLV